jgi:hypothetical protein
MLWHTWKQMTNVMNSQERKYYELLLAEGGGKNYVHVHPSLHIYKYITANYQTEGNTSLKHKRSVLVNFKHSPHYIYISKNKDIYICSCISLLWFI